MPQLEMRFSEDASVEFTIAESDEGVRARLLILLEEGGELSRTIEADDCEAAVEAIAFIAAVALDPGALEPLQVRKQERLLADKAVTRKRQAPPPPPAPSPTERSWTGGIYGRAHLGPGPDFLWGGGASLENSPERGGFWAPGARLAVGYARRGGFEEEFGTARFQLATADLDLCPSQVRGDIFRVQACGTMEAGVLLAEGLDTFEPARTARFWLGLGPSISSEIMLTRLVGLSYRGAAIFPIIRDAFRFEDTIFHEVPRVALELDAGVSVRF